MNQDAQTMSNLWINKASKVPSAVIVCKFWAILGYSSKMVLALPSGIVLKSFLVS